MREKIDEKNDDDTGGDDGNDNDGDGQWISRSAGGSINGSFGQ